MSNEKNAKGLDKRKLIMIGLIAAAVIMIVALTLILVTCAGGTGDSDKTPETTLSAATDDYVLYWNVDRDLYAGKDATGMSSREPNPDTGYFQITFAMDGRQGIRRVMERRVVNKIDNMQLMGLVMDDDGIIIDALPIEEFTGGYAVNRFYVEAFDDDKVIVNSSNTLKGMQVELTLTENTKIYDVTGETGDVGCESGLYELDCIIAIQNSKGEITHIYAVEREPQGPTSQHYCDHCDQEVTWRAWMYENSLPTNGVGHYYLYNDITLSGQMSMAANTEIVLNLNGKTVTSSGGGRMYSLHNEGCYLGIMDYSEDKTGKFVVTGNFGAQGGAVWVRYGKFEMWSGTLDASKSTNTLNGVTVCIEGKSACNFYGGTWIGGTAKATYNKAAGTHAGGLGGTVMNFGEFNMHGGTIKGGKALSVYKTNQKAYANGYGGNVAVHNATAVFNMTGGTIKDGTSESVGGNIWIGGGATFTMKDGTVSGGKVTREGQNGGNIANSANTIIAGGTVKNGSTYNVGGNIYSSNTLTVSGGHITGGKTLDFATKKEVDRRSKNIFVVNGTTTFTGGKVDGFVELVPHGTVNKCIVNVSGNPVIDGGTLNNLYIPSGTFLKVGKMKSGAKVSVTASGVFSEKTEEANKNYFKIDNTSTPVGYAGGALCVGEVMTSCICGKPDGKNHVDGCDQEELAWTAWANGSSLPTSGNWYLIKDVNTAGQCTVKNNDLNLSLNGHNINMTAHNRVFQLQTSANVKLTNWGKTTGGQIINTNGFNITANSDTWTKSQGGDSGAIVLVHNYAAAGEEKKFAPNLYIYDVSMLAAKDGKSAKNVTYGGAIGFGGGGTLGIYKGAEIVGAPSLDNGGTIYVSGSSKVDMRGGTIVGTEAYFSWKLKDYSAATPEYLMSGENKVGYGGNGGAVGLADTATMTMTAGTIKDGKSNIGGNIWISGGASFYMKGGTISGGQVKTSIKNEGNHGGNIYNAGIFEMTGGTIEKGHALHGGNISTQNNIAVFKFSGGTIQDGEAEQFGGNIYVFHVGVKEFSLTGGTIQNGKAGYDGGNLYLGAYASKVDRTFNLGAVTLKGGTANFGGSVHISGGNGNSKTIKYVFNGTKLSGGAANASGGNLFVDNNPTVEINNATFASGEAKGTWSPQNAKHSGIGGNIAVTAGTVTIDNSTIKDGTAGSWQGYAGGNIGINGEKAKVIVTGDNSVISGGKIRSDIKCKGGNVGINNGEFVLKAGKIHDGLSTDCAGNIHVCTKGIFTIEGGYVYNGMTTAVGYTSETVPSYASDTANVYVVNGSMNLYGGWIDGHVAAVGFSKTDANVCCKIQMKGSPKIMNIGTSVSGVNDATPDDTGAGFNHRELKVDAEDTVNNFKPVTITGTLSGTGNIVLLGGNPTGVVWATGSTNAAYFVAPSGYNVTSKSDGLYIEAEATA